MARKTTRTTTGNAASRNQTPRRKAPRLKTAKPAAEIAATPTIDATPLPAESVQPIEPAAAPVIDAHASDPTPPHVDTPAGEDDLTATLRRIGAPLLVEVAWEVVNQVGGIYTVLRSKLQAMEEQWASRYCVLGPYMHTALVEFEEHKPTGTFGEAAKILQERGLDVKYGYWLVTGRPRAVLMNLGSVWDKLGEIKYRLWDHHRISTAGADDLLNQVCAFGYMVEQYFEVLCKLQGANRAILGHFHEWMGAAAIPELRRNQTPVAITFTTHATMLGRYLAGGDGDYYGHLPFYNWADEAKRYNIEPQVQIERAAAHGSHTFCTVSDVTARECEHLLGRRPDVVTPNGLNIDRYTVLHEFQNLHRIHKQQIHQFVIGHFFPSYTFDLDNTLYVFTSGRFEYRNKGYDMTIDALAKLNWRIKQSGLKRTVVAFLITKTPYKCINADVMSHRAMLEEMRRTCDAIQEQFGERLFYAVAEGRPIVFDEMIDEYWRLRLRRTDQAWRTGRWPSIVTHDVYHDDKDPILNQLRSCGLLNHRDDPVKVVYHPDFITASNPLWGMDYDEFVRGCHVGVFPSYYEPWGYTPLESLARGIPAVTTDLSGFGSYVLSHVPDHEDAGCYVLRRSQQSFEASANQLAGYLYHIVSLDRRNRIALRNKVESAAEHFDWRNLIQHYNRAHEASVQRSLV